jgi:6-pyruvoyltetrahydropterin/6-carboxytetrahydropterin synthase
VLSKQYLSAHSEFSKEENLIAWDVEPTAENILIYLKKQLATKFPGHIMIKRLRLYETKDSFAELE